jgi:hypothetical protein
MRLSVITLHSMQSFFLVLLGLAFLGACIWFLHRIQLRRTVENADLTAPLDALDEGRLPELVGTQPQAVAAGDNNWLAQIRSLRESGHLDAALSQSKAHFPKTQAFQQAAIILRQQIREGLDHFQPVDAQLRELFHTAALADLFRTSSSHKPHDPQAALAAVRDLSFQYSAIGHLRLKLLNKSDVRALEQLWGNAAAHRHVEEVLGEEWLKWCRAPG